MATPAAELAEVELLEAAVVDEDEDEAVLEEPHAASSRANTPPATTAEYLPRFLCLDICSSDIPKFSISMNFPF